MSFGKFRSTNTILKGKRTVDVYRTPIPYVYRTPIVRLSYAYRTPGQLRLNRYEHGHEYVYV